MSTENFTNFLCSLGLLLSLSSCNVIQAVGGGETKIGKRGPHDPYLDALAYFNFEENDFASSFHSWDNARVLLAPGDTTDYVVSGGYGGALDCSTMAASSVSESSLGASSNEGYGIAFRIKPNDLAAKGFIIQMFESSSTEEISITKESYASPGNPGPDLVLKINGAQAGAVPSFFSTYGSQWTHVAVNIDIQNYTTNFYINGGSAGAGGSFSGDNSLFGALHVCNDSSLGNDFNEGIIDSLGIWDRQLSVEEISVLSSNNNPYEQ